MATPREFKMGTLRGLNTGVGPNLLAEGEASDNANCDYSAGSIRGAYGPGSGIATRTVGHNCLYWVGKAAWFSSAFGDWAMNDAPRSDGTGVSYRTAKTSLTTAGTPVEVRGGTTYQLGIPAPPTQPTAVANTSVGSPDSVTHKKTWCYTFVTSDGLESNPSPTKSLSTTWPAASVTVGTSADSRVSKCRIYCTADGGNVLSYFAEVNPGTTTTQDNSTAPDTTRPLNWGVGGNPGSSALGYDHSPAPSLTILSNAVHTASAGAGAPGSGIIFGAVDNIVRWSMLGYAHYWPTVNAIQLDETVQAVVTAKATTYCFTDSKVVALTGYADSSIVPQNVSSLGVLNGCGRTACVTPWGIMWLSREGVVFFAGGEPQVISRMLRPEALVAGGYTFAAYYDHAYYLFGAADTLVFDLRDGLEGLRVTRSSAILTAAHVTPYNPTSGSQGLYVLAGAAVKPWRPNDADAVPGASRLAWSHTTGAFVASRPHGLLRLNWCRPYGTGALKFSFYKDGAATPMYTKTFADASTATAFRLPGFQAREFFLEAESLDGTGELLGFSITGDEANGR